MGPLGQAIMNGVGVAMVVALAFLIFAYPTAQRLSISLLLGTIVAIATYIHAKRT
ncbi:MAG: hypothetical protein ACTHMX_12460 [Thermomicrobiales bacterium]